MVLEEDKWFRSRLGYLWFLVTLCGVWSRENGCFGVGIGVVKGCVVRILVGWLVGSLVFKGNGEEDFYKWGGFINLRVLGRG